MKKIILVSVLLISLLIIFGCDDSYQETKSQVRSSGVKSVMKDVENIPYIKSVDIAECDELDDTILNKKTFQGNVSQKSLCLLRFAMLEDNLAICKSIKQPVGKNLCLNNVLNNRAHPKTKEELQNSFIKSKALDELNPKLCDNLPDLDTVEECKRTIFISSNDLEGCKTLETQRGLTLCISQIMPKRNENLCYLIDDTALKASCEKKYSFLESGSEGLESNIYQGDKSNIPPFINAVARNFPLVWWAKDFEILEIEYNKIMKEGNAKIKQKDGVTKDLKLGYAALCINTADNNCCESNPNACKDISWAFQRNDKAKSYVIYCPLNLDVCKRLV